MPHDLSSFLRRWQAAGGAERANYQLFLSELCDVLGVDRPHPTVPDESKNVYVFDRRITATNPDGSTASNFIDLYKRGHFVLETKQGIQAAEKSDDDLAAQPAAQKKGHGTRGSKLWDDRLIRAKQQAEAYVRNIPDDNPPFLLVVDVGYSVETYADFSGLGKTYTPFPDNLSHRFKFADLADPKRGPGLLERLRKIFTDPHALNPARRSAKVTRDIADKLAALSRSLEKSRHEPEAVAHFLMRVLFTLFAEDVGLIPNNAFTKLLSELENTPEKFAPMAMAVWQNMDKGGFSPVLREDLLRFNGGLFADTQALPLTGNQLRLLIEAAKSDWSDVEPAIFGTLLERALHPDERHKLGAHYTPRAYVERLVLPTVIEPLREEWNATLNIARMEAGKGKTKAAIKLVRDFHMRLCETTVLDPACGSGNFLYVAFEHMKSIEGEVIDTLSQLGDPQLKLGYLGDTVDPKQFRGIEINPRAAAIADIVLWIGFIRWHFRTHGHASPPEPVLRNYHNIECRDAVLAYDDRELARDEHGKPLTRWDGKTYKTHPITGEEIPDENARTPIYNYINPRKAEWPKVDFVVGNPPFIGNFKMREALGDGYAEAIRKAYTDLPETIDFVMYWWHNAALLARHRKIARFGFIATNSMAQSFNRKVVQQHLSASPSLSVVFAIADHPWVDSADGAAVRIAMTVGTHGSASGAIQEIIEENVTDDDEVDVRLSSRVGSINADLTIGANVAATVRLKANLNISCPGVKLHGAGFIVSEGEAKSLGLGKSPMANKHIVLFRNGRDLTQSSRGVYVIDLFGLNENELRSSLPEVYQHVHQHVKPERDQNNRETYRKNWWIFGEPRANFRPALAGLSRYIATTEVSKHRMFTFIPKEVLADNSVICIALEDGFYLGVVSSRVHVVWSLAAGGTLEDRPRYNKTVCFEPFPFPDCTEKQRKGIRDIAEELDAHRKRQQAKYPDLALTDMYNVLEKLRAIEAGKMTAADITPKDKKIHDHGLVTILKQLHDDLDAAVFDAYGWPATLTDDQLLEKLVALNHQRATEEKRGKIRYLRPDFQCQQPSGA